jgi:LysR family transcriptional activator of mexEF-oprN operon
MVVINERDFRGVDLNLLLVFHALMQERHVTRAAGRLFLGQPAVSGALKRLRSAFGDELFVRTAQGMVPTARAHELAATIAPLLGTLQQALASRPSFEPAVSDRIFRVGLSDSLEVALMPALLRRLSRSAPGVRIVSRSTDGPGAAARIDAGEMELAIGVLPEPPAWQRQRRLFDWRFVCLFDARHVRTRGARITLAEYLKHPHVITSFEGGLRGYIDDLLEQQGRTRRVVFSSPHFATSPLLVKQMPLITTVPEFIAQVWRSTLRLTQSPLPFEVPGYSVSVGWSAVNDADPGLQWLLGEIEAAAQLNRPAAPAAPAGLRG